MFFHVCFLLIEFLLFVNSMKDREKEICDLIDFASEVQKQSFEVYKLSITLHNSCQRLLLKEKTGVVLKD